jgi:hypothetical protein
MTYLIQENRFWWLNPDTRPRQVVSIAAYRWPTAWMALPLTERCDRLARTDSPLKLLGIPSFPFHDQTRRQDLECVAWETGDMCSMECSRDWFRLWRRSEYAAWDGMTENDPPLACPDLPHIIEQWFAAEDAS